MVDTEARLLLSQKTALLPVARSMGLDPSQFGWYDGKLWESSLFALDQSQFDREFDVSVIAYRPRPEYRCKFGPQTIEFSPGREKLKDRGSRKIDEHIEYWFRIWLQCLRREIQTPDLWAMALQEQSFLQRTSEMDASNTPFTHPEQQRIASSLEEIKARLLEMQQFQHEQVEYIESKFEEIKDASNRLGRKDWINSFVGYLLGICSTVTLEPTKANVIFQIATSALQWLWGVSGKLIGA